MNTRGGLLTAPAGRDPRWWAAAGALLLLAPVLLFLAGVVRPGSWKVAGLAILASGAALLPSIWTGFRRPAERVLGDHLLLLASVFLVYFVLGALLLPFGPRYASEYALSFFPTDARMALRATAVNSLGMGLALMVGAFLRGPGLASLFRRTVRLGGSLADGRTVLGFLLAGAVASFFVYRMDLGWSGEGILSGSVRLLAHLVNVAIVIAAAHRGTRGSVWMTLALVLVVVQAALGLVMLNKLAALLPFAALLVGFALRGGGRRIILPGSAGLVALFLLLGNPVNMARNQFELTGRVRNAGERIVYLWNAVGSKEARQDDSFYAWARICYLPAQAAALDLFDRNQGGADFSRAAWVLVPRALFSDKPIITSGQTFEQKVTGYEFSKSAPGIFADGYFNLGWWGVVLVGGTVGLMLALTSALATAAYQARALLWFPLALLGNLMAFRIDGQYLSDFLGPFAVFLYLSAAGAVLATFRRSGA